MKAIYELKKAGYQFTLEGDQIRYHRAGGMLSFKEKTLLNEVKAHKAEAVFCLLFDEFIEDMNKYYAVHGITSGNDIRAVVGEDIPFQALQGAVDEAFKTGSVGEMRDALLKWGDYLKKENVIRLLKHK